MIAFLCVWGSNMTMNEKKQEIEWRLSRRYGLQITLCDNLTMWAINTLHYALFDTRYHTDETLFFHVESVITELSINPLTHNSVA